MDNLTATERSKQMALVRSTDTKPEVAVRRLTHAMGYRFRLHGSAGLKFRPVTPSYRLSIMPVQVAPKSNLAVEFQTIMGRY